MEYIPLSKIYYSANKDYESIYQTRLSDKNTVKLNFYIHGRQAFFLPIPELYEKALSITKIDKHVLEIASALPGAAIMQFAEKSLIDEVMITNDIEGVYSTRQEIKDVIDTIGKKGNKRFKGLVNKFILLSKSEPLDLNSCENIRNIYDDLVLPEINPEDRPDGVLFRKNSVGVHTVTDKEIHRGLTPERAIYDSMNDALHILHAENIQCLFRIALFHYMFGYIHPFYDGNGRTSRFISSYLLSKELHYLIGYRISYSIKNNIKAYYKAFEISNGKHNRGDLTPFLITFLEILEESMKNLKDALEKRQTQLHFYNDIMLQLLNHPYEPSKTLEESVEIYGLLIQASLFSEDGISTRELMDTLKVARQTLSKRIKSLPIQDIIIVNKISHEKFYLLDLDKLEQLNTLDIYNIFLP